MSITGGVAMTCNSPSLSHNQRALWAIAKMSPDSAAYNVYANVRIRSPLDTIAWRTTWEAIANSFEILRLPPTEERFHADRAMHGCRETQGAIAHDTHCGEFVIETGLTPEQAVEHLLVEVDRPFNLETGPIIRFCLFEIGVADFLQLVVLHEIAGELRSLEVLLRLFRRHYPEVVEFLKRHPEEAIA